MPDLPFEDSRRLTGSNPYFSGPGVALEVVPDVVVDDARLARWRAGVLRMFSALGWTSGEIVAHMHPGGASLAFGAPADQLLCATEVNEWAWGAACGVAVGEAPGHPATWDAASGAKTLHALARDESSPALIALLNESLRRAVPALVGEELLTLGSGSGGQDFQLDDLPGPGAVRWDELCAVPAVLVTGSNGKTTTVRLIAALLSAAKRRVGFSCTDGLFVVDEQMDAGDFSGPIGARTVLRRRDIDVAVLETARGGLLRRGLAVQRADVAVVTNVSVDHFGEYGIHTLADLVQVKLAVARAIDARGLLVLNADDLLLRTAGLALGVPLGWFSLAVDTPFLHEHAASHPACVLRADHLWLHPDGVTADGIDLGDVAAMPLAVGGAARYNLANLAAAALAAFQLGVPAPIIAQALADFGADNADNRGRLERWELNGVRILLDYAHNPEGVTGLLDIATTHRGGGRLAMTLGHAGNRLDDDIRNVARAAARYRPDRVVLKEIAGYERGRKPGEVASLMRGALIADGVAASAIDFIPDEVEAAQALLDWAQTGDVVVLLIHTLAAREAVTRLLDGLAGR